MSKKEHKLDSFDLDLEEPIFNVTILKFSAGEINLTTGEVELEKEVSESAKEFWKAVEKFYPLEEDN